MFGQIILKMNMTKYGEMMKFIIFLIVKYGDGDEMRSFNYEICCFENS